MVSVTLRLGFSPGERTPGTYCTGGWVGPRAGVDTGTRGNNPFASAGDRTSIVPSFSDVHNSRKEILHFHRKTGVKWPVLHARASLWMACHF
jgi:hypothetical protein